jgi:putative ABC transport system permease protein
MLINHLKVSFRSLWKNKRYTLLNLMGLSLAMATCLLILQYVGYELSFDQFHENKDQLYRVVNDRFQNGERVQKGTITYPAVGPTMVEEYPEIEACARLFFEGSVLIHKGEDIYRAEESIYADEYFFDLFSFEMLARDGKILLDEPFEIVLTEKIARHFFDIQNDDFNTIINQTLELDRDEQPYRIVGVCKNLPSNSLIQADVFPSYASFVQIVGPAAKNSWQYSDFYHYLKINQGADIAKLEEQLVDFSARHFKGDEVSGADETFYLQPLNEAHLYSSDLEYEIGQVANGKIVWSMLGVAFFILLLAWVNYINMASVRAIERAKEVGIRRVVGASRHHLLSQFLTESALVNGISLGLGVLITFAIQPWLNQLFSEPIFSLTYLFSSRTYTSLMIGLLCWIAGGVLLSGVYPTLLLLRQRSSEVLKGSFKQSKGSQVFRQGLVVFQFAASVALISLTIMAFHQLRYLNKQDLGINLNQVLRVSGPELMAFDTAFIEHIDAFKTTLAQHPDIQQVSMSSRVPGDNTGRIFGVQKLGSEEQNLTFRFIETDHDFDEAFELPLLAGRDLKHSDHNTDFGAIQNIVINKKGVTALGYNNAENAIGRQLKFWGKSWTIVGVLENYHQQSFHHPIEPTLYLPVYNSNQAFSVRLNSAEANEAITYIHSTFSQFFPGNIFEYQFLDQRFQRQYDNDQQFGSVILFFTILAIFIAFLGILGLASYMAFLRTKEIGIRKVLGASLPQIIGLLSKRFIRLAFIGAVLAIPIAWYITNAWLADFVYRVDIHMGLFALAGLLAVVLALVTVEWQSMRAAMANPVDSLKIE